MIHLVKIAFRNLLRYRRRTLLTSSLIAFGVVLVIVFGGLAISFRSQMIGTITNGSMGDLQIHATGYVESIDNTPLHLFLADSQYATVRRALEGMGEVEAFSPRIKFGAMISNYAQTSNIRLTAIRPDREMRTVTDLAKRISRTDGAPEIVQRGEVVVPATLMKGLGLRVGDDIVLIATNREGSVNGIPVRVGGVIESVVGPTGKDGYVHIDDAINLLRMDQSEINEVAVKLKSFDELKTSAETLRKSFAASNVSAEVHTWEQLSPFATIARIVDLLVLVVKFILISIVLVSILNIMTMSVFERVSEIGTIAAMGTPPARIRLMFLIEGLAMGLVSTIVGTVIGVGIIWALRAMSIEFRFGTMDVSLVPSVPVGEVMMTVAIVTLISLLASVQPASRAASMEPVDALGHV